MEKIKKIYNDNYMERKKINSLLYTLNLKEVLKFHEYKKIDLELLKKVMIENNEKQIVDEEMKENIYYILQNQRYEQQNKNIDLMNDIIRITNASDDEYIDSYLFIEYARRLDQKITKRNKSMYFYLYLDCGRRKIKNSIALDYCFIDSILNKNYNNEFNKYIVPELLVNSAFIYSINTLMKENIELLDEEAKNKILYILKNSKKLMNHIKCPYELDENDYINFQLRKETNKLYKKLK